MFIVKYPARRKVGMLYFAIHCYILQQSPRKILVTFGGLAKVTGKRFKKFFLVSFNIEFWSKYIFTNENEWRERGRNRAE